MPHPGTTSSGEGESETVFPTLPSANAYPSPSSSASGSRSSSILPPARDPPLNVAQLQQAAMRDDAGAEVDLKVEEMKSSLSGGKKKALVPPKGWLHFVAGGVGGMCGAIITSPLDVVKTRLQSDLFQQKRQLPGTTNTAGILGSTRRMAYHFVETGHLLGDIARKEGLRALFKGLGPTLVGVIPARSINFYTYGNGKQLLAERFNGGQETPVVHLVAASAAGVVTATATNPIWVVKTRLQLESHAHAARANNSRAAAVRRAASSASFSTSAVSSAGSASARAALRVPRSGASHSALSTASFFKAAPAPSKPGTNSFAMALRIIQQEGISGLYKGLSASYLGVAEGTIQWVLYERLKRVGTPKEDGKKSVLGGGAGTVGAAGSAKLVASLITYPHEVIRTRLRQQPEQAGAPRKYTGLIQTIKVVLREEGAAALYGGLSAHLLRVVPNAAVMFSIYEVTLHLAARSN